MENFINISTESYSTQDKYSLSSMAKSLVACGVLAASISGGSGITTTLPSRTRPSTLSTNTGSAGTHVSRLYESYNPTWSNVSINPSQAHDSRVNIPESLSIIKMLAFIEGDTEAEIRADDFFYSKQFSTKKVLLRSKK